MVIVRSHGPVDAGEAWDRYARPSRWPMWSPQITRVSCGVDRLFTGVTGRVHGPLGAWVDFVVDEWDDAARRWSWTVRRGPLRVRLDHGVDVRGSGSSTFVRVHAPLPIALGYVPLAKLALHRLVTVRG